MKYPKESLPHKPTSDISDKKYGFFQSEKGFFEEVAAELGLLPRGTGQDLSWYRHPLAFLVEAADDICYTIIDFEDGINLGLIPEEYALEYMVKLVGKTIDRNKYNALSQTSDRVSYLRALAINTLINEAVETFMMHEDEILSGNFHHSLLDKSAYQAQITDIINLSIDRIYNSREVIEKEIAGYEILSTRLEAGCKALDDSDNHFNRLIQKLLINEFNPENSLYQNLIQICLHVSTMTDGKALRNYKKIKGLDVK